MKKQILTATALVTGLMIGASALSTFAAWTAPAAGCTPPACNTDAPVNVGQSAVQQKKLGGLWLNTAPSTPDLIGLAVWGKTILNNDVEIAQGSPAWGKVLMATNASGTVSWVATSTLGLGGGGGGGGGGSSVTKIIAGENITIDPTTGVGDVTINAEIPPPLPITTVYGEYSGVGADSGITLGFIPLRVEFYPKANSRAMVSCNYVHSTYGGYYNCRKTNDGSIHTNDWLIPLLDGSTIVGFRTNGNVSPNDLRGDTEGYTYVAFGSLDAGYPSYSPTYTRTQLASLMAGSVGVSTTYFRSDAATRDKVMQVLGYDNVGTYTNETISNAESINFYAWSPTNNAWYTIKGNFAGGKVIKKINGYNLVSY